MISITVFFSQNDHIYYIKWALLILNLPPLYFFYISYRVILLLLTQQTKVTDSQALKELQGVRKKALQSLHNIEKSILHM